MAQWRQKQELRARRPRAAAIGAAMLAASQQSQAHAIPCARPYPVICSTQINQTYDALHKIQEKIA
jgi:hypothetical protein